MKKICKFCSKSFTTSKKLQKYCSRVCSNIDMRKIRDPQESYFREKITRLRGNAKNRKIPFDLTWEDLRTQYLNQNGRCYYTGNLLELTYSTKDRKVCPPNQLSVDRVDSNGNYNFDNIVLCCYCVNNFKGDSSLKEFEEYIRLLNNKPISVKIKRINKNAELPKQMKIGDAAFDISAQSFTIEKKPSGERIVTYGTGLALEIPKGYVGLIYPRSSIYKTSLSLCNHVGVIDSNYRGEIMLKFRIDASARPYKDGIYNLGDRIGQIMITPYPKIEFEEVEELSDSARGISGFGSSGK